ncbi:hydroxymethylglutaryl-CoA reductase [Candidatus Marsarchaeota archaeon]|nr:hydroxymethylglutaryl-CoA reductase [Candidatus Marsarchaeota archaeon]
MRNQGSTNKNQISEALEKIKKGEIKLHELSKIGFNENQSAEVRRRYLSNKYNIEIEAFTHIKSTTIDLDDAAKRNISNIIGATQVPLGFVEININGDYAKGISPVFLATTEGRLVDGIGRAAKALNEKGVSTKILKDEMTRSVIIIADNLKNASKINDYIKQNFDEIKKDFLKSSSYINLKTISTYVFGKSIFIRYAASTGAAMGMNMITIAAHEATINLIEKLQKQNINSRFFTESGNMCIDKKPGFMNQIMGRGISISAEAVISKETVEKYFKISPKKIVEMNYLKNYIGSSLAGTIGNNAHMANILAAIFIAYGQDVAQIVDSTSGYDNAELTEEGDLYFSINLPALEIGTFGGGTARETQKEILKASKIYGENDNDGITKYKFAEIIAAAVLAGELNLLAALSAEELSKAHGSIKRG